mmetsp:Transcript_48349/g.90519  ORF Transcript_48349/g.90519 Transcript_48349/m.90519 type:complete len:186 (+) Transcript_48349:68-625(+)
MPSPLLAAAYFGNVDELMDGLRDGEDIEAVDTDGCRPLHAAVMTEQEEAAVYLLKHKADLESAGPDKMTPLLLACRTDASRMVRLLLDRSADVTAVDAAGRGAYEICLAYRSQRAQKALAGDIAHEEAEEAEVKPVQPGAAPLAPVPSDPSEPWFGSAVDPTNIEADAERDALHKQEMAGELQER